MNAETKSRVNWVDYAKGICITLVVLLHTTWGVHEDLGRESWMGAVSEFAGPFRMPDFFLLCGLFLARTIDRDWRIYFDRKVLHFVYFYALWVTIQFALKAPSFAADAGWLGVLRMYAFAYVQPFAMMWFIYLLPIFFVVTKLLRNVSPFLVFLAAAALEAAPIHTGWIVIDEFAWRYVYFFTGYWLAPYVFALARAAQARPVFAAAAIALWAALNSLLVFEGLAGWPGVSLFLGFAGAAAVVTIAAMLAHAERIKILRYAGEHSIVIYLAFFLPMAVTRIILLRTGIVEDPGLVILIVAAAAITGSLVLHLLVRNTWASFLFVRPDFLKLRQRTSSHTAPNASPISVESV